MDKEELLALVDRIDCMDGPDKSLSESVFEELGWQMRKVTSLGLNGRTPGRYLWFSPNDGYRKPHRLPDLRGPRTRKWVLAALEAKITKT